MSENRASTNVSGGIGFAGLLTRVFIVLKLLGVINWSWLWVLAPLWISVIIGFIIFIGVIIFISRI